MTMEISRDEWNEAYAGHGSCDCHCHCNPYSYCGDDGGPCEPIVDGWASCCVEAEGWVGPHSSNGRATDL